jgi:hypothetical protein
MSVAYAREVMRKRTPGLLLGPLGVPNLMDRSTEYQLLALQRMEAKILAPGAMSVFTSDEDCYYALTAAIRAKDQGHAICYDETFEAGRFVMAHVLHYKNCVKCNEEAKHEKLSSTTNS